VPTACTPALSGGGIVDYGNIKAGILTSTAFTALDKKQLDFSLTCNAVTKAAIKASTGGVGSALAPNGSVFSISPNPLGDGKDAHGVGLSNSVGIGGYTLSLLPETILADANSVDGLMSDSTTGVSTNWSKSTDGGLIKAGRTRTYSWATPGTLVPVGFTNLTGKLEVHAYINKSSALNLANEIKFSGRTTIEVIYL
jgi:hypothetical protein